MTDWEAIVTRVSVLAICIVALYVALQALSWNYITSDEFLLILWGVLAAWGIGIIGTSTFKMGNKTGYREGYAKGLEFGLSRETEKKRT